MILPILRAPHPTLRAKAKPVDHFDDDIRVLTDSMIDTMHAAPGVGLAAPQVGLPIRVVVIDGAVIGEPLTVLRMANPRVVSASTETVAQLEACLSVPGAAADVMRPACVLVQYIDQDDMPAEIEATGKLALVLQHEIDHLDGVLFIDHLSPMRRAMTMKKLAKGRRPR